MEDIAGKRLIRILSCGGSSLYNTAIRIVLTAAPVLLGTKPSCTLTLSKHEKGIVLYSDWLRHKRILFRDSRLRQFVLYNDEEYVLLLLYDKKKLENVIFSSSISDFLEELGYSKGTSLEDTLFTLRKRFLSAIPHEIGVFLGIPLKDVMGFMGMNGLKLSTVSGWQIYGDTCESSLLHEHYENCRARIISMLSDNADAISILRNYPNS
jgi:hypothetical protein